MNEQNLKPCPFCGSYPILRNEASEWKVECSSYACGCMPSTWWCDTKEEVIEAWNRRAADER